MAELFDGVKYRDGKSVLESVGERIVTDPNAADDVQYRKAEADPSKDTFLGALRKVVAEHVGGREEKVAAAPQQTSPALGKGAWVEPPDREAETAARPKAARVFAELQTDWKAHVVNAQRRLGGHPFYPDREWAVLAERARREWLTDELREAYASLPDGRLIEEAIAEGYREWYLGEIEGVVQRPDLSGKDPIPVAKISSRLAGLSAKEAKDDIRGWAKGSIRGVYRNADTGWDIRISLTEISESTGRRRSPRHNELEVLAAVPDLLQSMVRYESEPDKDERPEVRAFHHFAGAVNLDGKLRRIRLTVKERGDGRLFYDHCLLGEAGPSVIYHAAQGRTPKSNAGPPRPTTSMAELFDGVKYRDGKSVLESVGERIVTDPNAADDVQYRKAEADPSKDAFLNAYRKVVPTTSATGMRRRPPPPRKSSPAAGEGARAEPAAREAEAAARGPRRRGYSRSSRPTGKPVSPPHAGTLEGTRSTTDFPVL